MTAKSAEKKNHILTCAQRVFIRKGYAGVTMKDVIEECGISRGGIYLYFSSVDEIFTAVIHRRNQQKLDRMRVEVDEGKPFGQLLAEYIQAQKRRLFHMEDSLKAAMYEYTLAHKSDQDRAFYAEQFESIRQRIREILCSGVTEGVLREEAVELYEQYILLLVEGMSSMALSGQLTEKMADEQFQLLWRRLYEEKERGEPS